MADSTLCYSDEQCIFLLLVTFGFFSTLLVFLANVAHLEVMDASSCIEDAIPPGNPGSEASCFFKFHPVVK